MATAKSGFAKPGLKWSLQTLGDEFGIDRRTVSKLLSEVETNGMIGGHPTWSMGQAAIPIVKYVLGVTNASGEAGEKDPNDMVPKDRKDWYDSELKRVKHEEMCGGLIPAHLVANADAAKNKKIALSLDTMADVLERDANLNAEQVLAMNRIIDSIRNEMYTDLMSD